MRRYKEKGINVENNDIRLAGIFTLVFSATTWAFINSIFTELPQGSPLVKPIILKGWRIPDFNCYLVEHGLSLEIITGYQLYPQLYLGIEAEMVCKGVQAYEVRPTVQYAKTMSNSTLNIEGQLIVNYGLRVQNWSENFQYNSSQTHFGSKISVGCTFLKDCLTVKGFYIYHNLLTLVGERNIPFIQEDFIKDRKLDTGSHEIGIILSYNY